ncbi:uncharacterized protein [Rutidosis leptorrhynchoides]|uniref:uncharacterized protein n=1 Tax=Rutidosis leptorrhynchoides TaxID=125765 RepID=UPI003A996841
MTKAAIDRGLFMGVRIGNDNVLLSHLQYADDTIFIGEWSRENILSLRYLLHCFKLASRLKINFQKSCLYGIGTSGIEVENVANILGCLVGQFPFTYLGLPIGSNMKKLKDWKIVIEKFQCKLASWKMRMMSFGGRLTLIKSVLSSLPLYYFSLFRAPSCVLKILEQTWQPTGRTAGDLEGISELLSNVEVSAQNRDGWAWTLSSNNVFTIKCISSLLDEKLLAIGSGNYETNRNNLIPKKVEILAWRIMKKRLPVRVELDKRAIDQHSIRCPLCDDGIKTIDHIFIFCKHSLDIWTRVFNWWGLGSFTNLSLHEIISGNSSAQMSPFWHKIWKATSWVCVYLLWKNRNNLVFHGKMWNPPVALNEIQTKSFE